MLRRFYVVVARRYFVCGAVFEAITAVGQLPGEFDCLQRDKHSDRCSSNGVPDTAATVLIHYLVLGYLLYFEVLVWRLGRPIISEGRRGGRVS